MCLILFALRHNPEWPFVLIANRDEFYERPAEKAHFWGKNPDLLAGRDLQAGGTWMGIRKKSLRLAALTNYRNPLMNRKESASRGEIVRNCLESELSPEAFLKDLKKNHGAYNAFNLICGNPENLFSFSSTKNQYEAIVPGIHGLSNHLLDTPWPKVKRGCHLLEKTLEEGFTEKRLLSILKDREQPADEELPDTGIGLEWERVLSSIFIRYPGYGTRCSTILLQSKKGEVFFTELSWNEKGEETGRVHFEWQA
ncbi:NRDE family protein [Desulfococcaceae bacterium OttesenSCG-928-F15]|nr:NRDE family protein [Desulfococcaceae bacterium OttesenSCG-928-F15]